MPMLEPPARQAGARRDEWRRFTPWRSAMLFGLVGIAIAIAADRWHAGVRRAQAEAEVVSRMATHAEALHGAVDRRLALLTGLRTFAESRRSRSQLDEEFPLFAQGSVVGVDGVRAMQFVERGRIVATYPTAGNEGTLGYDLLSDPRAAVARDVERALESGAVTVSGPMPLIQGGLGMVVRRRLTPRPGFPDLAAIVLDLPALVREAGIPSTDALVLELRDRDGNWIAGDPSGAAIEPESLPVTVVDGDWTLLGAPTAGWASLTAGPARAFRIAAALLVFAVGCIGYLVGSRERHLRDRVDEAGSQLDFAMRAGRMGSWAWDVRTNAVGWSDSAARLFGFEAAKESDPISRWFDAVHPDDREGVRTVIASTARGDYSEYNIEYRLRQPDGTYRWVSAIGELERDDAGRPAVLAGVVSDATQRRRLEERVREGERMEAIGHLAGGVAHDFNNLLTAMRAFTDLALLRAGEFGESAAAQEVREDLRQVLATVDRGAAITAQLLAFSRRAPIAPRPVDLSAAVGEMAPMLTRLLLGGASLATELADGLPNVRIDPGQLTQMVMNLVVNARDAMPNGGTITIRTSAVPAGDPRVPPDGPPGPTICLEVEDQGTGIPDHVRARLFEPFFTTKEDGKGTGLGLPVVLAAVETAGGAIAVDSTVGIGTTFRAYLPVLAP